VRYGSASPAFAHLRRLSSVLGALRLGKPSLRSPAHALKMLGKLRLGDPQRGRPERGVGLCGRGPGLRRLAGRADDADQVTRQDGRYPVGSGRGRTPRAERLPCDRRDSPPRASLLRLPPPPPSSLTPRWSESTLRRVPGFQGRAQDAEERRPQAACPGIRATRFLSAVRRTRRANPGPALRFTRGGSALPRT